MAPRRTDLKQPALKLPTGAPAPQTSIGEWTTQAQKYLEHGIERAGDAADANGNPPDWLVVGKTELANLDIGLGRYDEAAKLLTEPPHSVVASIAVTDEATRPAEGVKGRPFASYVFQSLLRAQIGRHQVDASLEAMQQLEKIAGASGAEGVTAIYVSLGKEIEKEIARLIATNDRARLVEVRKSFEKFLEELARCSDTMSYGSLLWIAETYTGLGDGLSDDPDAARDYFAKAAHAYEDFLTCAKADTSPLGRDRVLSLELRRANCLKRQGAYSQALETLRGVIAKKPRALDVQVAAAGLLQDWGRRAGLRGRAAFSRSDPRPPRPGRWWRGLGLGGDCRPPRASAGRRQSGQRAARKILRGALQHPGVPPPIRREGKRPARRGRRRLRSRWGRSTPLPSSRPT